MPGPGPRSGTPATVRPPRRPAGSGPPAWLRPPRPTARLRLTLFYSAMFIVSGAGLLAITYILMGGSSGLRLTSGYGGPSASGAPAGPRQGGTLYQAPGLSPQQALDRAAIALAIMAVASVVLGWIVAGRVLRPVRTMSAAARRISAGNLHGRLAVAGPDDEFTELGQTFDDLLGRLEAAFESQRHFVANASHELRTPVTVERAILQVALANPDATTDTLRSACEQALASGEQQERLIEALLTLASSERGLDRWEAFDLAAVTGEVLNARRQVADRGGVRVQSRLTPAPALGDPSLARSLVANLVDNALRYNSAGGWVEVLTGDGQRGATVTVANSGPPVPAEEVARLFRPFQRLQRGRTRHVAGHGLGLAIVQAIANAHGARIDARPIAAGGLEISVFFIAMASPGGHHREPHDPVSSATEAGMTL
jgi:signal transduction histidine kinase